MSKAEACIAYVLAECERKAECDPRGFASTSACASETWTCPDVMFATGSNRTVENLLACAATWKTFSCDAINASDYPACAVGGSLAGDAGCAFSAECAADYCQNASNGCGTCAAPLAPGGDCSLAASACPAGYPCSQTGSRVCAALPDAGAAKGIGSPCTSADTCIAGYTCRESAPDAGDSQCRPLPGGGEPCSSIGDCASTAYCNRQDTCTALPPAGQPCGDDRLAGNPAHCDANSYCNAANQCVAKPGLGQTCGNATLGCADPSTCLCPVGDAGLSAATTLNCATPTCVQILMPGAACGQGSTVCHPSSVCQAGVCVPLDSQGLAAQKCGH